MQERPTKEEIDQIGDALAAGNKIEAIKIYRAASSKDLKESKDFIEALALQLYERDPQKYAKIQSSKGKGCAGVLLFSIVSLAAILPVVAIESTKQKPATATNAPTYRNPILPKMTLADPTVIRVDGTYYLYPTDDCRGYDVYTSTNLVHWTRHGKCYTDRRGGIWAPDVFHNRTGDKKFYLYYTADKPAGGKLVGVAVADSPLGPFVDRGVLAENTIDAHLFRDDDGALYLYLVDLADGFKIVVQPMADPVTKKGSATMVIHPTAEWEKRQGEVTEGPWMMKRNGTYYLMYSGSGAMGPEYGVGYATSKSPMGPFTKYAGNPIAHRGNGIFGPGHHCVVEGPDGGLWMVYHQKETEAVDWRRFLAIDPLWFDDKGVIHVKTTRNTDEEGPIARSGVRLPDRNK